MRFPQGWELVVVLAVIVLLFGTKKLPDAARGLGRSLRIFKSEIKTMQDEDAPGRTTATATPLPPTSASSAADTAVVDDTGPDPHRETPPRVEG